MSSRGYRGPTRRRVPVSKCGECRNPLFCQACTEIERAKDRRRSTHRRRARKSPIAERYSLADVASAHGWACWICGTLTRRPTESKLYDPDLASVDHLIPLSLAGPDIVANTRLAHLRCNISRGAKFDIDHIGPMLLSTGIAVQSADEHRVTWCWLDEL